MKKVVITSTGVVAPTGVGRQSFFNKVFTGKCCIRPIELFNPEGLDCKVAGEVKGFDPEKHINPRFKPHRFSRQTQLAIVSVLEALQPVPRPRWPRPLDIYCGGAVLNILGMADSILRTDKRGPRAANPFCVPLYIQQSVVAGIAAVLEYPITPLTISTACAAGADALVESYLAIARGQSRFIVTVGADGPLDLYTLSSATRAGLTPVKFNDRPEESSRPFDSERESGVISEGSGCCLLEEMESALLAGRSPLAEIIGYGRTMDLAGGASCNAMGQAMAEALADARLQPADIDFISAWGPGHPVLDREEVLQIKQVFGKHAYRIPVGSIKGCIGNPFSAAGILQVIAAVHSLQTQSLPPTANYHRSEPELDLFFVPRPQVHPVKHILVNAHGVGGGNTSLILRKA